MVEQVERKVNKDYKKGEWYYSHKITIINAGRLEINGVNIWHDGNYEFYSTDRFLKVNGTATFKDYEMVLHINAIKPPRTYTKIND